MTDEEAKLLDAVDEHFEELICGDSIEPKIVLSLNEAKALNNLILKLFYNEENRMSVFDATELLTKRIKQAEGKR